jgi:chaperonin GroEL (HSP60 family)
MITIGSESIEFHGFCNINQPLVDAHIRDAEEQYEREQDEIENARYVTKTYIEAKDRLARIACKSAMIHVGGHSTLEKKLNDDALDDAIRACSSTISYGYNLGNNIAIFRAIKEAQIDLKDDEKMISVGEILYRAFANVIHRIHTNKDPHDTLLHTNAIIENSLKNNMCFDLNTEQFTDKIINSCRTDIEILRSAITIIGTILSANQYVAADIMDQKEMVEKTEN